MKVKELIKLLEELNPNAEITVGLNNKLLSGKEVFISGEIKETSWEDKGNVTGYSLQTQEFKF